ncbi:hypothetical protein RISK_002278 [Rhodopirellula islandica]|uniref:Uncharacterized protein n=1 Tax=Rhodopirellula islandica TaxID=595434 RepID=A0A0J1BGJ7_RHOIS|nr:hypothetical protein RISK_002278 [Rhodopirellula islandica]
MANGQHQPTRFGLNLAVGQNGSVFSWSTGVARWLMVCQDLFLG